MKSKYFLFLFIPLSLACNCLEAQRGTTHIDISYSAAFPTGSFKAFIGDPSFAGVDLRVMHGINDHLSVGFGTGFQAFYQKYPRQVYKLSDGSDVSAVVSNTIEAVPLLLRAQYNFLPAARIQPFIGAGVGGNMLLYSQYLGQFADNHNRFVFQASPEAGIFIPFHPQGVAGISLRGFYNIIPFKYNGLTSLNSVGFTVGIGFPLRN